jgi:hypothetical protein
MPSHDSKIRLDDASAMEWSPTPARRRQLHRGHFDFMRAFVKGLRAHEVWERILIHLSWSQANFSSLGIA